jgi:hypothetical protein
VRTLIHLVLWNIGFVAAIAFVVVNAGGDAGDMIGMLMPGILATWILWLGGLYAKGRFGVVGCATAAGILYVLQALLLVVLIWWSQGFGGRGRHTAMFEVFLLLTVLAGPILTWWLVRSKRAARPET